MPFSPSRKPPTARHTVLALGAAALCTAGVALAQSATQRYPITPQQRGTAQQVAQAGVALSELAPNAPSSHTVKRGDTLWDISALFLKSPWRWPELWGMNLQAIRNPHLIYPGQVLVLDTSSGRAILRFADDGKGAVPTVKVSPRVRSESLADNAIPALSPQQIEPFLTEAIISDEESLGDAPRIVAAQEGRVLLSRGDRAYARGLTGYGARGAALSMDPGEPRAFRVFRNVTPLKDPTTGEVLGYEAKFLGRATLARPEEMREAVGSDGKTSLELVPATIDIVQTKEEIRAGDRLLPEPPRAFRNFVPTAAPADVKGQVVSVYGNAVTYAGQNQVVVINRGAEHGLLPGHVLAVLLNSTKITDTTDKEKVQIQLPGERNGLMMVFRTFERVSYALVLEIADGVTVGARVVSPNPSP
ncbi:MAG TPA: LysM peptidoglycan-binding domain-containing protein [Burkholderiaceae bacterium]|nr:LysM peptidoglycan-binding domain-containing protein [Burkholderiaceae bacterium]